VSKITWGYLEQQDFPHDGADAVVHLPRIESEEYASLIGKPQDPKLTTMVKEGAWYTDDEVCSDLLGPEPIVGTGTSRKCRNSELGIDPNSLLAIKYKPCRKIVSVTGCVMEVDKFE
jgi:hypothetical protein